MPDLTMTRGARLAAIGLLILTLIVGAGNLWATYDQAGAVRHAAATVTELCQAGNQARAQQVGLWEYIIHISKPPAHETPAQAAQRRATIAAFTAHLHKVFAPRNCAQPTQIRSPR